MVLTGIWRGFNFLKLTNVLGLLAVAPVFLCLEAQFGESLASEDSKAHQKLLYGPKTETSLLSAGNALEIPLRRKFIQYAGRYYFLNVSVGSPGQSLELFVDTGSSDTWVYGSSYCDDSEENHYQCCKFTSRLYYCHTFLNFTKPMWKVATFAVCPQSYLQPY